ncbi:hypothetical protein JZ751_028584 [Albula glossodonta]|uniref:Secondary ossification center associated regulator of chondrocyte maturation n=1 Tax=Albula glossodonta TaxID=121402 RepID=A0A8T2NC57_9TELE|nr:hypothetical protein JZ751_028584 [Albula glossodonta]
MVGVITMMEWVWRLHRPVRPHKGLLCAPAVKGPLMARLALTQAAVPGARSRTGNLFFSDESLETSSGGGAYDVTTKDPFHDLTENAFTFEYEDATHSQPIDGGDGGLGPGAITAIVIAVILGASVLIALVVITLKKFTAA